MSARQPQIDAYLARQADFARPTLDHLRSAIRDLESTAKGKKRN